MFINLLIPEKGTFGSKELVLYNNTIEFFNIEISDSINDELRIDNLQNLKTNLQNFIKYKISYINCGLVNEDLIDCVINDRRESRIKVNELYFTINIKIKESENIIDEYNLNLNMIMIENSGNNNVKLLIKRSENKNLEKTKDNINEFFFNKLKEIPLFNIYEIFEFDEYDQLFKQKKGNFWSISKIMYKKGYYNPDKYFQLINENILSINLKFKNNNTKVIESYFSEPNFHFKKKNSINSINNKNKTPKKIFVVQEVDNNIIINDIKQDLIDYINEYKKGDDKKNKFIYWYIFNKIYHYYQIYIYLESRINNIFILPQNLQSEFIISNNNQYDLQKLFDIYLGNLFSLKNNNFKIDNIKKEENSVSYISYFQYNEKKILYSYFNLITNDNNVSIKNIKYFNNINEFSKSNYINLLEEYNTLGIKKKSKDDLITFINEEVSDISEIIYKEYFLEYLKIFNNNNLNNNNNNVKIKKAFLKIFNKYLDDNNLNFIFKLNNNNNFTYDLYQNKKKLGFFTINIEKINNEDLEISKSKYNSIMNITIENIFQNKGILHSMPSNHIIPKNIITKKSDNLLILSYNELGQSYTDEDIFLIKEYINRIEPAIIVIGTQESAIKTTNIKIEKIGYNNVKHFQHLLKKNIQEKYSLLDKFNAGTKGLKFLNPVYTNRNVRTRIYIHNKKCSKTNNDKFKIKILKSKKSKNSEIYKGSILYGLDIELNGNIKRFIFVNSHLCYKSNNKKTDRSDNLIKLIDEFQLIESYKNGTNIFFFGDLETRLSKVLKLNNINTTINTTIKNLNKLSSNEINKHTIMIIKNYLLHLKSMNNNYLQFNDEIYYIIYNKYSELIRKNNEKKLINNEIPLKFYSELLDSINKSRTMLTSGYQKNNHNLKKLYELTKSEINNISNNKLLKHFEKINKNKTILQKFFGKTKLNIPSNPDRILYTIHKNDVFIRKNNLKIFLEPSKSNHKVVSLKVDLKY